MTFRHILFTAAALGASLAGTPASAHPELVTATPAAKAAVAKASTVRLMFSERLTPKLSMATLVMTGMPGMANHPDMKMPGVSLAISPDGKSMVLTSANPLPAGTYRVDWAVVGADKHRIAGKHAFSIR